MIKEVTLAFTTICAVASLGGYLVLNEKIIAGERFIAEGQSNIALESPSLVEGKAELATGKGLLSEGKKEYERAHDNPFLVFADKLFNSGKGFAEGRKKIAEGEEKVAKGEDKVDVGEKRLDQGNEAIRLGKEKLQQGKLARDICAIAAIVFTLISLVLGFLLRRSLVHFFMHPKA